MILIYIAPLLYNKHERNELSVDLLKQIQQLKESFTISRESRLGARGTVTLAPGAGHMRAAIWTRVFSNSLKTYINQLFVFSVRIKQFKSYQKY